MSEPAPSPLPSPVAVIGCGWLGAPLASALLDRGAEVRGSATSAEKVERLRAQGIGAELLRLNPQTPADDPALTRLLDGAAALVLTVPPPRGAARETYPALLAPVLRAADRAQVPRLLFTSSTGVYPDEPREMTEEGAQAAPDAPSVLLRAEALAQTSVVRPVVLRLAGLYGPGRPAGRFLAGRKDVPGGGAPVNLLHLEDAVGAVLTLLQGDQAGTFNVCAAAHPLRRDFYPAAARALGLEAPTFAPDEASGKTVSSARLRRETSFRFRHDDLGGEGGR
ncbi:SDR family oxidoreductase [Deinococcus reticulitermitis]|uniref:SDR family oxidoreductase n=1 Tax=Deinococcus reticulitermitis TaxID=856736 RepID=UPI000B820C2B|nr:SDR family oxidoreductase [Deinococcus reticulitermitis]